MKKPVMFFLLLVCSSTLLALDKIDERMLYAPGHFGNYYECAGENEMKYLLTQAREWGFNRYGDWFDMIDCSDPFTPDIHALYDVGDSLWAKKKANFKTAQQLGFKCDLIITPNHVYFDQYSDDIKATVKKGIFGQLICPSNPKARQIIINNYKNLFADLKKAGVKLSSLCAFPYDYGGCACDKCDPWIVTFAELCCDIHKTAQQYFPDIELDVVSWWWSRTDYENFVKWVDSQAPGLINSIYFHVSWSQNSDLIKPKGCKTRAFVHISSAENRGDDYGKMGPVIAPQRIADTVNILKERNVDGFMGYSEGICDEINFAILAGLGSAKYYNSKQAVCDYVKKYFGCDKIYADKWADWLCNWGSPFENDTSKARNQLNHLLENTPIRSWRTKQWQYKTDLFTLHREIMELKQWDNLKIEKAKKYMAVQEKLYRDLWGLGLTRNVISPTKTRVPWMGQWLKIHAEK